MVTVKWIGPFLQDELFVAGVGIVKVAYGATVSVSAAIAQQMLCADGGWWAIEPQSTGMCLGAGALAASQL